VTENLPRDLDYIVLKALRSEPEERYTSVERLADDIRSLLEGRPVEARSGDTASHSEVPAAKADNCHVDWRRPG
jgi:hypothetical protein